MVRPSKFDIQHRADGSTVVLSITGELDMDTVEVLAKQVDEHLEREPTALTLDLRGLAFMDSSGLRLLIELNDRAGREPWRLRLISPQHETAAVVLRITGADKALPFERAADA